MDIDHIEWMMQDAFLVCQKENIDDSLLLPLVILHDVGYSKAPKDNPFKLNLRKAHMKSGAIIARHLLEQVNYHKDKIEKIAYYISVHDNWAFGELDIYKDNIILGAFKDLDYLWILAPKGFPAMMKVLKKSKKDMLKYASAGPAGGKKQFSTLTTKDLYKKYIEKWRKKILGKKN